MRPCEEHEEEEKKTGDEEETCGEMDPPPDPKCPTSAEERGEDSEPPEVFAEAPGGPGPPQVQRHQETVGGPQLNRWDKTIIEKIRSYYEAAAKAEEGGEEEELGEGSPSRRRNSFSEIPSGLVKESVSQFNVGEHRLEERSTKVHAGDPNSPPAPDQPISCLDSGGAPAGVPQETPNRGGPVGEEVEILGRPEKVYEPPNDGPQEDREELGQVEESTTNQFQNQTGPGDPEQVIEVPTTVPSSTKEPCAESAALGEHDQRPGSRTESSWTRNGHKDSTNGGPASPGQMKTGRWSHHSRIVSANRVLFEAMGSDVAGIGLFEAGPVVDPVLMENSARILSRVQTLALMYGAKAGAKKVHQNQGEAAGKPSMRTSKHQDQVQDQVQPQGPAELQRTDNDPKHGTRVHLDQPQSRGLVERGGPVQKGGLVEKGAPVQEVPLGDGKVPECLCAPHKHQPDVPSRGPGSRKKLPGPAFTLSRPRDFISALNRSSSRGSAEAEAPSRSLRAQSPSPTRRDRPASTAQSATAEPGDLVTSRSRHGEPRGGTREVLADAGETGRGAR